MSKLYVVVDDELRMGDVKSYGALIGENIEGLRGTGEWEIDHKKNRVYFISSQSFLDADTRSTLQSIKNSGFYSPQILGYKWCHSYSRQGYNTDGNYTEI